LRELDEAETLVGELQDFRMEFTAAGHLTFNARCGKHDDLVRCGGPTEVAIGSWALHQVMRRRMVGAAASEPRYYVGVDLGQSRDPTAIAVVRRLDPPGPSRRGFRLTYARGPVEWEEERRLEHKSAQGETVLKLLQNRGAATEPLLLLFQQACDNMK